IIHKYSSCIRKHLHIIKASSLRLLLLYIYIEREREREREREGHKRVFPFVSCFINKTCVNTFVHSDRKVCVVLRRWNILAMLLINYNSFHRATSLGLVNSLNCVSVILV
ncbi:hypothetical protein PanWU01x14_357910, partial [Parasponia andersonii]